MCKSSRAPEATPAPPGLVRAGCCVIGGERPQAAQRFDVAADRISTAQVAFPWGET